MLQHSLSGYSNLTQVKPFDVGGYLADKLLAHAEEVEERNLAQFTYDPIDYVETILGYIPYAGMNGEAGQAEILNDYAHCIKQQHERYDYQNGIIGADDLTVWEPGQVIKNTLSIDAGHNLGKTFTLALMVNHFIDCFTPSIIYSYAPKKEQIKDLLWKEIKTQRQDKGLQGRILELRLDIAANHFAKGVATDNSHGTGTEKAQGQHGKYLMFVIDEAEGVPAFVYDAIESMTSGGVANIVIVARNPRTRTCRAHKIRSKSTTKTYRLSCLNHPNVVTGREVVAKLSHAAMGGWHGCRLLRRNDATQ